MAEARVCFLARKECAFLLGMIKNVKAIIEKFTSTFVAPIIVQAEAEESSKLTITDIGVVAMIYYKAFNELYPENPDDIQRQKIDAVLNALRTAGVITS
jgi:pentose-5-phosphate-3-epimerase